MEKTTAKLKESEVTKPQGFELLDQKILDAVHSIRYGSVEIIIHDAKVVQLECKEKVRFKPAKAGGTKGTDNNPAH